MLPRNIRERLFERLSVRTMRHVRSVPRREARGLAARVYDQVAEDFFINGSITCQSKVPELMAGMWTGGRECILVGDRLDRTTKEAMSGALSQLNQCSYCADMLVSLVYGAGEGEAASGIFREQEEGIADPLLRERLAWIRAAGSPARGMQPDPPFAHEELPEAIATLFVFSYVNRLSHIIMDGSPVGAPFGLKGVKAAALRVFGLELKTTTERPLEAGKALSLLPEAPLPDDMEWAAPNPRIAAALARWAAAVEREAEAAVSPSLRDLLLRSLSSWKGELMPLSRSWVEDEVRDVPTDDRAAARLALLAAKSFHQVDDAVVEEVLGEDLNEARFIRVLAWAAFSAARRLAENVAREASRRARPAA